MTRNEFALKLTLALAANPKYVELVQDEDDPACTCPAVNYDNIMTDVELFLDKIDREWPCSFEEADICDKLTTIAKTIDGYDPHLVLDNIEDSLRDIARTIDDINQSGILVDATVHDGD